MGNIFSKRKRKEPNRQPPRKTEIAKKESLFVPDTSENLDINKDSKANNGAAEQLAEELDALNPALNVDDIFLNPNARGEGTTSQYRLVVAIDFGTTYSGYCYAYINGEGGEPEIHVNKNWESDVGGEHFKIPTCVCLKNGEFHSMGYDAQNAYSKADDEDDAKDVYSLFQNFKMELYGEKIINENFEIESRDHLTKPAIDIFAMAIKFFKDHCLQNVTNADRMPNNDEILWILTVPAIWGDAQKAFMRKAAKKAGLVTEKTHNSLMLALEPEAASLYCRKVKAGTFQGKKNATLPSQMPKGHQYIVVDAGGGTIDITFYEALENGKSKELRKPSGNRWGGSSVNTCFEKFLEEVFDICFVEEDTQDKIYFMQKIKQHHHYALYQIMQSFEHAKKQFKNDPDTSVSVPIPMIFGDCFMDVTKKSLKDYFKENQFDGVKLSKQGSLLISCEKMKNILNPVGEIINHLKGLVTTKELFRIETIFLVGGFAHCEYLQTKLKEHFESSPRIIIPESPDLAVVKGAVYYGSNPDLIDSRIAPRTYAIAAYDENGKKFLIKIVGKGESVKNGQHFEHYAIPEQSHLQSAVVLEIYASDGDFIRDPDDPRNHKVGNVSVQIPMRQTIDCLIHISITFGSTEIKVECKNEKTNHYNRTFINFEN